MKRQGTGFRRPRAGRTQQSRGGLYYCGAPSVDLKDFFSAWDLLWVSGNGVTPQIGPGLTAVGTPTAGQATPFESRDGAITSTQFAGTDSYKLTTGNLDPAAGEDVVAFVLVKMEDAAAGVILDTLGTRGVRLYAIAGTLYASVTGDTAYGPNLAGGAPVGSWRLVGLVVDRSANSHLLSHSLNTAGATPAGALGAGDPLAFGARFGGASDMIGEIAWVAYATGTGIADAWTANSYARYLELVDIMTGGS